MEAKEERDGTMAPPPNAEGVEGVEAVLAVTGLTEHQIERFIKYESITSIDDLKAYANHDTVVALVLALAKVWPVAHQAAPRNDNDSRHRRLRSQQC